LAQRLGVSLDRLRSVAANSETLYKPFLLGDAGKPFSRGPSKEPRPIDRPTGELLQIQSKINSEFLSPILFPEHINGAVKKRTIYKNAECHRGATLLVTLDVKQCFPSITPVHIYRVWAEVLGCSPEVASLLTKLTTFRRRLPQGAPTSPALANLLIWSIDLPVRTACDARNVVYSTWLDDLAFSGLEARSLIAITISTFACHGLRFSHRKIKIMGPRHAKYLTGTRAGRYALRVPKEYCGKVRAGIHNLGIGRVESRQLASYITNLIGRLQYIERVSKVDAQSLKRELAKSLHLIPTSHRARLANFLGTGGPHLD
jgi:RNA-directed DNA polymerase